LVREVLRDIEACTSGFLEHGLGWFPQGDKQANSRLLPLQDAGEIADLRSADVATLDLGDNRFRLAAVVIEAMDIPVYASISALSLVLSRSRIDESQGPPFKLVAVLLCQGFSTGEVLGRT
jgi:hypothetical protein